MSNLKDAKDSALLIRATQIRLRFGEDTAMSRSEFGELLMEYRQLSREFDSRRQPGAWEKFWGLLIGEKPNAKEP